MENNRNNIKNCDGHDDDNIYYKIEIQYIIHECVDESLNIRSDGNYYIYNFANKNEIQNIILENNYSKTIYKNSMWLSKPKVNLNLSMDGVDKIYEISNLFLE